MDTLDLVLAILHHVLVFSLAGIIAAELALVRPGLGAAGLPLLGRIDGAYGGVAVGVIVVGVCRVVYGLKGWEYFASNHAFWGKMAAFAVVGLLSIVPTLRIVRWRKVSAPGYIVPAGEIARVRRFLKAEVAVFALIPILAAMMARGYGS